MILASVAKRGVFAVFDFGLGRASSPEGLHAKDSNSASPDSGETAFQPAPNPSLSGVETLVRRFGLEATTPAVTTGGKPPGKGAGKERAFHKVQIAWGELTA